MVCRRCCLLEHDERFGCDQISVSVDRSPRVSSSYLDTPKPYLTAFTFLCLIMSYAADAKDFSANRNYSGSGLLPAPSSSSTITYVHIYTRLYNLPWLEKCTLFSMLHDLAYLNMRKLRQNLSRTIFEGVVER